MNRREEVGVPPGSLNIEVDGVRLSVAREGQGPAVVCLHAIGHGGGDFEVFAAAVRDRFEVIRIDWPGQGRSGADSEPLSPQRYATLLAGVLERLGVEEPIIVGNSIGGAAAIIYAKDHPVRALVLCDTGGLVPINTFVRVFCKLFARFFAGGERGAWWFGPLFRAYYRYLVLPSPAAAAQRERVIAAGSEVASVLREAWAGFGKPQADIRPIAVALDVPVWFAWARKDRIIPLSACTACIKQMKRATITQFEGGHAAFLEQPEAFAREFMRFFEGLGNAVPASQLAHSA